MNRQTLQEVISRAFNYDVAHHLRFSWSHESPAAKMALYSGFFLALVSHLFIYTSRYFGDHDVGTIVRSAANVGSGRWLSTIINQLSFGYVLPFTAGLFISIFIAISAYLVCKFFDIKRRSQAVIIAGLLATFPAVGVTNLFIFDSPNNHFALLLSVLAVYVTRKCRGGFFVGALLLMCVMAIYQAKINVALIMSLLCLIKLLMDNRGITGDLVKLTMRFSLMAFLAGVFYWLSLQVLQIVQPGVLTGYRGMSTDSIFERLFSLDGFWASIQEVYNTFSGAWLGDLWLTGDVLLFAYGFTFFLALISITVAAIRGEMWKHPASLIVLVLLLLLIPLAGNFTTLLSEGRVNPHMVFSFVFVLIFAVVITGEKEMSSLKVVQSLTLLTLTLIIPAHIIINNIFYLQAYYFNARTTSLTTRLVAEMDPLIPQLSTERKDFVFFGGIPNEYYLETPNEFAGTFQDDGPLRSNSFIQMQEDSPWQQWLLATNIRNRHGVNLYNRAESETMHLRGMVLDKNMPMWPAEGSVSIIEDIIVINFSAADIAFISGADGDYLQARHWVSEGHSSHDYEYRWHIYSNGKLIVEEVTTDSVLEHTFNLQESEYRAVVTISNITVGFTYPSVATDIVLAE